MVPFYLFFIFWFPRFCSLSTVMCVSVCPVSDKQAAYPVYFSDNPLILTWRFPAPTAKLTSSAAIQREVIARQLTPAK
jgi:hypothetical protein